MQSERMISLEAVDRARNVFRFWRWEMGRDLFGQTVVAISYGRTGTGGRAICRVMGDEIQAVADLRSALMRRATAKTRCGASYRVTACSGFVGAAALAGEAMAREDGRERSR
jgi:predicted DNA-binding WGR domain protein